MKAAVSSSFQDPQVAPSPSSFVVWGRPALAFCLCHLAIFAVHGLGICYETADDFQLSLLHGGGIYGLPPSEQLFTLGHRVGQLLHGLSWFFPRLNVYNLFLCATPLVAYFLLVRRLELFSGVPSPWLLLFALGVIYAESVVKPNCTQTTVLVAVPCWLVLITGPRPSLKLFTVVALLFFYATQLRFQVSLIPPLFLTPWLLWRRDHVGLRWISMGVVGLYLVLSAWDHAQTNEHVEVRKEFNRAYFPILEIFDFHNFDLEDARAIGMSENDYQMWAHYIPLGETLDWSEKILSNLQMSSMDRLQGLAFGWASVWNDLGGLRWYLDKYHWGNGLFWLSLLCLFALRGRLTTILTVGLLTHGLLLLFGLGMTQVYKMVPRLWDPLLLVPVVAGAIAAVGTSGWRPRGLQLILGLGCLALVPQLPLLGLDRRDEFLERDILALPQDGVHLVNGKEIPNLWFTGYPHLKRRKVFIIAWMGASPLQKEALAELGLAKIPEDLLDHPRATMTLTPVQKDLIAGYFKQYHNKEIRLVEAMETHSFGVSYRLESMKGQP